jgi:hypothetical protein
MPPQNKEIALQKEGRILLAIQSFKKGQFKSLRAASRAYDVPLSSLQRRMNGVPSLQDYTPVGRKLSTTEESVIVRKVLELSQRGFHPRVSQVGEMANILLQKRNGGQVGQNWATTFIKRHEGLKTKWQKGYDYKRALCECPKLIGEWFERVQTTIAKYGLLEEDIYNFDEAGFALGVIGTAKVVTSAEYRGTARKLQPGNKEWASIIQAVNSQGRAIPCFLIFSAKNHLSSWYMESTIPSDWAIATTENGWTTNETGFEWIKHFNKHTESKTVGRKRLLILDGHESHHTTLFEDYCQENNIITLCMPPHSSHLLQPLDVGVFSPLKAAYRAEIERMMRYQIHHITKLEFLPCLKVAFDKAFTTNNIKSGFRATGLVPFDPQRVLEELTVTIQSSPAAALPVSTANWVSKTPRDTIQISQQADLIVHKIQDHKSSSPTPILEAFGAMTKGFKEMSHEMHLLKDEVKALRETNERASQRGKRRKKMIQKGGVLTFKEGQDIINDKAANSQLQDEGKKQRHCSKCKSPGHNSRTCKTA